MEDYIGRHIASGGKLAQVTKHMLGLFAGQPGARRWKRVLSEGAHKDGAGFDVVKEACRADWGARAAREEDHTQFSGHRTHTQAQ